MKKIRHLKYILDGCEIEKIMFYENYRIVIKLKNGKDIEINWKSYGEVDNKSSYLEYLDTIPKLPFRDI